ncbi:prepilin-type N-terminal cleavage/methylation domain-containing protein [Clostridium pascui]|uniref:type II secretion system protein n=1 Tax=Clostridium pascui TaxID=46609 RepID=UPI00195A068C|nr:type II secretion system protein [Clostridium pascui]MBM7869271.1 prepilin-type N-terminal cleavage/methylation domain-containing protein [Clostridium pascui]
MARRKRGFTLIELVISLALIGTISLIGVKSLVLNNKVYYLEVNKDLEEFYINEAFIFIEYKITKSTSVEKTSKYGRSMINLISDRQSFIELYGSTLIISYDTEYPINYNNIMYSIKGFDVEEKGNVIYIKIIDKYGDEYERCFGKKGTEVLS